MSSEKMQNGSNRLQDRDLFIVIKASYCPATSTKEAIDLEKIKHELLSSSPIMKIDKIVLTETLPDLIQSIHDVV